MRKLICLILLIPLIANAVTEDEFNTINGIVDSCHSREHFYSDSECFEVLLSTQIILPEWLLCSLLPLLRGCPTDPTLPKEY